MIHALALDQKLPKTLELRDQFESFHSWDYTQFLVKLFPVFENLIATIVPSFTSTDDAQILRCTILEIFMRFPRSEPLKLYASPFANSLLQVLRNDNEENVVLALKILLELYRDFKNILEDHVQSFLDFVKDLYRNMPYAVDVAFNADKAASMAILQYDSSDSSSFPKQAPDVSKTDHKVYGRSMTSFKVLTECPIIVVLLFQQYRRVLQLNCDDFITLTIEMLTLQAKPQIKAQADAERKGQRFSGISPDIKNKQLFCDFIGAQVKTLSFLAYLFRSNSNMNNVRNVSMPDIVMRLFQECPQDSTAIRKELLVATRHILSTDFRNAFILKMDLLLDENGLTGTGYTAYETLRPLAYSTLADLIHHIRSSLSAQQIARIISIFCRNLHDPALSPSIQTMCAKLLLNLIDCVVTMEDRVEGRRLAITILSSFVEKFSTLRRSLDRYELEHASNALAKPRKSRGNKAIALPTYTPDAHDVLEERQHFRNLLLGLKTIILGIRHVNLRFGEASPLGQQLPTSSVLFEVDEMDMFVKLFSDGLAGFRFYTVTQPGNEIIGGRPITVEERNKELTDALECFAAAFILIDPAIFQEVIVTRQDYLFQCIKDNPLTIAIPRAFLSNETISPHFFGVLLRFLVDKLDSLGSEDEDYAETLLKMFKLVFMAVPLFPDVNESVILPHLTKLINGCMKLASTNSISKRYFLLLRALFRSIGGGRFESLYKEVLPLLPSILEGLNIFLSLTTENEMRELFVELCLTVPVRLSVLLPYLVHLMHPLVYALQAGPDLVSQGLRTLELCIDNLTQEFLDPILAPVIDDLMNSLYSHLKPEPLNDSHSITTLRILGKLGGRNRRHKELIQFENHHNHVLPFNFLIQQNKMSLHLDDMVPLCEKILFGSYSAESKRQAFSFIQSALLSMMNLDVDPMDLARRISAHLKSSTKSTTTEAAAHDSHSAYKTQVKREHSHAMLEKLILLVFYCASDDFSQAAKDFSNHIILYFSFLFCIEGKKERAGDVLDPTVFIDALLAAITSEHPNLRRTSETFVLQLFTWCKKILPATHVVASIPAFNILARKLCSCCYHVKWSHKRGGCYGISLLSMKIDLGKQWIEDHLLDFVRALLYMLKDMPFEIAAGNVEDTTHTLLYVIRVCHEEHSKDDIADDEVLAARFNGLVSLLIADLSSANEAVRKAVQASLEMLSQVTGCEDLTSILAPVKDRLLGPIYAKPLRALPIAMQIGYIDAITYCMNLRPFLLHSNEELMRLITETLAFAEAEDQALISRATQKNIALVAKLRVVCIQLLTAAMSSPEFSSQHQNSTRQKIISTFFKCLYNRSPEVVETANKGLKQILAQSHQQKIQKELLQQGLRPILMNLSDPRRLTVGGLQGLASLLKHLSNYFKPEIGNKLIDHLRSWPEASILQDASGKPLSEINEIQIIIGMLEIFPLLPALSGIFLEDLLSLILHYETTLHRNASSPFRAPFLKYAVRYPAETVDYFFTKFPDHVKFRLFASILREEDALPLCLEVVQQTSRFLSLFEQDGLEDEHVYDLLAMADAIVAHQPDWLSDSNFLDVICDQFRHGSAEDMAFKYCRENKLICHFIVAFLNKHPHPQHVKRVLDIVRILSHTCAGDFYSVRQFVRDYVQKATPAVANQLIKTLLHELRSGQNFHLKTVYLKLLLNPLILYLAEYGSPSVTDVLDSGVIIDIQKIIYGSIEATKKWTDAFKIEVLRLTDTIVQHFSSLFKDKRSEILKMMFSFLKTEDATVKHATYVVIARCLATFELNNTFDNALSVFVALLRSHQSESRLLVRQSLDILAPVLPRLMHRPEATTSPAWVRWLKRVLVDDGHTFAQLGNIYAFLIHHDDAFYPYRSSFCEHLINMLPRLAMQSNSSTESKVLALDLAELIYQWEIRYLSEGSGGGYSPSVHLRDILLNFLVVFVCTLPDTITSSLPYRVLRLFRMFIKAGWSTLNVKVINLESTLLSAHDDSCQRQTCSALEILRILVQYRSDEWVHGHLAYLQSLLTPALKSSNYSIASYTSPILSDLVRRLSMEYPQSQSFFEFIQSAIREGLPTAANIQTSMLHLTAISSVQPSILEAFMPDLARLVQKLTKEHLTFEAPTSEMSIQTLTSTITLMKPIVCQQGEHRRYFLTCIIQLIENSNNLPLLRLILSMVSEWMQQTNEIYPTMKEKANLLSTMISFDGQDASLVQDYLELVASIYENAAFTRSELTVKLETSFLLGMRSQDHKLRDRFIKIFHDNIAGGLMARLHYALGVQNWDSIAHDFWITAVLELLLLMVSDHELIHQQDVPRVASFSLLLSEHGVANPTQDLMGAVDTFVSFATQANTTSSRQVVNSLRFLVNVSEPASFKLFRDVFAECWKMLTTKERQDLLKDIVPLLAKGYHLAQSNRRPNVPHALLDAILNCTPRPKLPPYLVKYTGQYFCAWHSAILYLESDDYSEVSNVAEEGIRESSLDALSSLYETLSEDDMFYGLWRRRCHFKETAAGLCLEQHGYWSHAQAYYESVQMLGRTGSNQFGESEYDLWNKRWIHCTMKLQQWDILLDLSRHESNPEMFVESAWRMVDAFQDRDLLVNNIHVLPEDARRKAIEAFQYVPDVWVETSRLNFQTLCDEGVKLALQEWTSLPEIISTYHESCLHLFQQLVELQESSHIVAILYETSVSNFEIRQQEVKSVIQSWRERLPNFWNDINQWSDVVAWRQIVFNAINKCYLPLSPVLPPAPSNGNASGVNSSAYRGYHETAWMINRFAWIARKHGLLDVCSNQLAKIYTLPNIEIQEAFVKLKEQARCHYSMSELANGLDVINNTNLMFFTAKQKAEFFALKGLYLYKLDQDGDANTAFSTATQLDVSHPKVWAYWGQYNDHMFIKYPNNMSWAVRAMECYLQASSIYGQRNPKARRYIARIIWLLGMDDAESSLTKAFEAFKGDVPIWYWLFFVPQLICALSYREAKQMRLLLIKIARTHPQALYYHLRTAKEEFLRKRPVGDVMATPTEEHESPEEGENDRMDTDDVEHATSDKPPWEIIDDVMSVLKTSIPLLALSIEGMVDQIVQRLKPTPEEELYRIIAALLNDSIQSAFERDIAAVLQESNLLPFIEKLSMWKKYLEHVFSSRPRKQAMEQSSSYLVEFEHRRFEDVDLPGQFLLLRDTPNEFIRIERFVPEIEFIQDTNGCSRRITIIGHNGIAYPFLIQYPTPKSARVEERMRQLFSLMNSILDKEKATRGRKLNFYIPNIIPLSYQVRMIQDDARYQSLYSIYEEWCYDKKVNPDEPVHLYFGQLRQALKSSVTACIPPMW